MKETQQLHAVCGAYLHFKALLKSKLPATSFNEVAGKFEEQFRASFLDADLEHALQTSVPPGDLKAIGFCRSIAQDFEAGQAREIEAKHQELTERLANATLDQLRAKIEDDFKILTPLAPSPEKDAIEASLDLKYMRDRQQRFGCYQTLK